MPAEILPAVSVGGSLLVLGIGHVLLWVLSVAQGVGPYVSWLWLPLLVLAQLALTLLEFDTIFEHGAFLVARCWLRCRFRLATVVLFDASGVPAVPGA